MPDTANAMWYPPAGLYPTVEPPSWNDGVPLNEFNSGLPLLYPRVHPSVDASPSSTETSPGISDSTGTSPSSLNEGFPKATYAGYSYNMPLAAPPVWGYTAPPPGGNPSLHQEGLSTPPNAFGSHTPFNPLGSGTPPNAFGSHTPFTPLGSGTPPNALGSDTPFTPLGSGTPQNPRAFPCKWDQCSQLFATGASLYTHLCENHIGRKSLQTLTLTCHWGNCRVSAAKRDHITSHLRVHVPWKPFACTMCDKEFKRRQDLTKHVKLHGSGNDPGQTPETTGSDRNPGADLRKRGLAEIQDLYQDLKRTRAHDPSLTQKLQTFNEMLFPMDLAYPEEPPLDPFEGITGEVLPLELLEVDQFFATLEASFEVPALTTGPVYPALAGYGNGYAYRPVASAPGGQTFVVGYNQSGASELEELTKGVERLAVHRPSEVEVIRRIRRHLRLAAPPPEGLLYPSTC